MRFNYKSHQAPLGIEALQPGPRVTFRETQGKGLLFSCASASQVVASVLFQLRGHLGQQGPSENASRRP